MKNLKQLRIILLLIGSLWACTNSRQAPEDSPEIIEETRQGTYSQVDLSGYPSSILDNGTVKMNVFHPDPETGIYRATRFDWSGVIGSVQYKDHEYFGYWKDTQDPLVHEDLTGPVEGWIEPGLGYQEANPGEGFIRIGVGIIEKPQEEEYRWADTYNILDHGEWKVEKGTDWIKFTHSLSSDFGYAYEYHKTIKLKNNGFTINHILYNTGAKQIETDQFNHNFFMIDGEISGPAFTISFPYDLATEDDLKGMMSINGTELQFNQEFINTSLFMTLTGYGNSVSDHAVTVLNNKSGAGVKFTVDQPLYRMCFWACETTLSPENFIWISVNPGESMEWNSEYTLFVE